MKKPNIFIIIIFIAAIIYAIYNLGIPSSKKILSSNPNWSTDQSKNALESGNASQGKSSLEKDTDKKFKRRLLPWGKDPFIFPEGKDSYKKKSWKKVVKHPVNRPKKVVKRKAKPLSIKITSILISEDQKVATIDRAPYVVTIGDWIENEQVLEIMPDRVIFGNNGITQEILLKSLSNSSRNFRGKNET